MEFFYPFEAVGEVGRYAPMGYTVAWLPAEFAAGLPEPPKSRPRVIGELAGVPFKGALHPTSDGRAYFIFNKVMQKKTGLALGDPVPMAFRFDDPDAVDVPPELAEALRDDEGAGEVWQGLTPGTQRGFAHRVSSAKTHATRVKRVVEVLAALEEPDPSPYPKRRKS
ncbi:MAG: YdeI/OmpD-associated family protein [Pseudomonadota bacterium]